MKKLITYLIAVIVMFAAFILLSCSEHNNIVGADESGELQTQFENNSATDDMDWANSDGSEPRPKNDDSSIKHDNKKLSDDLGKDANSDDVQTEDPLNGPANGDDSPWVEPTSNGIIDDLSETIGNHGNSAGIGIK